MVQALIPSSSRSGGGLWARQRLYDEVCSVAAAITDGAGFGPVQRQARLGRNATAGASEVCPRPRIPPGRASVERRSRVGAGRVPVERVGLQKGKHVSLGRV